jgi:hypothetical protein
MNKENAKKIVESALDFGFDDNSFKIFISNLLKTADLSEKPIRYENINEQFKAVISECLILGQYKDDQKNQLDILKITLLTESSLERARSTQRNFIAHYLKNSSSDAAIVAFITPESSDWRFSLVKLEYIAEVNNSKLKTKDEVTPAKRWSFLVGKNEGCHTAISRFVPLLESDINPNLDEIQNAFNIERVTDEFYEEYKNLFHLMKDELDSVILNNKTIKNDFESKELRTEDFAKKTLGQLVFIYFLQKKGWFGMKPGESWSKGSKSFLRDLFNNKSKYGCNFFNDVLEFLFYEALASDRGIDSIYKKFDCKIPFLNGGLFEPMNGYSWETTEILLNDELFSNKNVTPEGDIGNGILDIFDRYNFTVNESEPLEKEVAVDPEMLGKIFENLLEIKDRKSKGAFYTPREIVQYMCQESLIGYLNNELRGKVLFQYIETFIRKSYILVDLNHSHELKAITEYAIEIDGLLANIKICDPAVGSGAFPIGMLNEIVNARYLLRSYLSKPKSIYDLKLHTISQCLYGVDIDPSAIEIARLRFWLALIVDEDSPTPLPNLDHKLMQGNSLISNYEGIELFDSGFLSDAESANEEKNNIQEKINYIQKEYFLLHSEGKQTAAKKIEMENEIKQLQRRLKSISNKDAALTETESLFDIPEPIKIAHEKTKILQSKISQYISVDSRTAKQNLKQEIDDLKWDLIEATLEERKETHKLDEIKKLRKERIKPFFIWRLEFGEVFKSNGGFDVVIGNPPYGGEKITTDLQETLSLSSKDIYGAFISKAINGNNSILKNNGFLSFIVSDTFMTIKSHLKLRKQILNQKLLRIIRLHPDTFKATVNTAIVLIKKAENNENNMCEVADFTNISVHEEYDLFLKILEETRSKQQENISNERYSIFYYPQELIFTNTNLPFFMCHPKLFKLMNDSSGEIPTNQNLNVYIVSFNGLDVELIKFGDVAEVRQGLATGDNESYFYQNSQARGNYRNIEDYKQYLLNLNDLDKIINDNNLKKKVIEKGFHKSKDEKDFDEDLYFDGKYILPYDKGGGADLSEGWLPNYFVLTEYYIDWSTESINRMNSLTIKERDKLKGKVSTSDNLCAVIRNPDTYFRAGITFSWTGQYSPTFRIATPAPYDHGSSAIFCNEYSAIYLIGLTCSKLLKFMARNVINHTVNFGIDDVKDFIIPFKSTKELEDLVSKVINKQKQNARYDYMSNEQKEIDKLVYQLYGLNKDDIQEVEKWYARRYPKLRKWCYIQDQ